MSPDEVKVELVEGVDFYREGAAMVFTETYHLRRGYCCESGCRHCPYRGAHRGERDGARRDMVEDKTN
jgi:hypothetical protein